MKRTRVVTMLLILVLVFSLCSCSKSATQTSAGESSVETPAAQTTPSAESVAAPDTTEESTPTSAAAEEPLATPAEPEPEAPTPEAPSAEPTPDAAPAPEAPTEPEPDIPAPVVEENQSYMASLGVLNDAAAAEMARANGIVPTTEYFPLEEKRELSMWYSYPPWMDNDMNERLVYQMFEAATNIHMNIQATTLQAATSEFQLMIASGDYPDVFYQLSNLYKDYELAIDEEVAYDLKDIIESYCPTYNYLLETFPDYKEGISGENGEYLEFTSFSATAALLPSSLYIRQDWLDELGLEKPVTYDDMHDVAAAFRDNYGCETAVWIHADATQTDCLMAGYGIAPNVWVEDGKAQYLYVADGFREYLTMLHQWVEEGIITRDFFSIASNVNFPSDYDILDGGSGIYFLPINVTSRYVASDPSEQDRVYLTPLSNPKKSPDDVLLLGGISDDSEFSVSLGMGWSISTQCEDLETAGRWIDYWYTEEGSMTANYGQEGLTYVYNDEGKPVWTDLIKNNPDGLSVNNAIAYYCQFNGGGYYVDEWKTEQNQDQELLHAILEVHSSEKTDNAWPSSASLSVAETEIVTDNGTDVGTAAEEWILGFIVGNKDLNTQWDEYLGVLDSMGMQEIIACYQSALDRYYDSVGE